jgi:hypothetical protein
MKLEKIVAVMAGAFRGLKSLSDAGSISLVRQLDNVRDTVERFRKALDSDDTSTLIQTYYEYLAQIEALEARFVRAVNQTQDATLSRALAEFGWQPEALYLEERVFGTQKKVRRTSFSDEDKARLRFSLDILIGHLRGLSKAVAARLKDTRETSARLPAKRKR